MQLGLARELKIPISSCWLLRGSRLELFHLFVRSFGVNRLSVKCLATPILRRIAFLSRSGRPCKNRDCPVSPCRSDSARSRARAGSLSGWNRHRPGIWCPLGDSPGPRVADARLFLLIFSRNQRYTDIFRRSTLVCARGHHSTSWEAHCIRLHNI